MASANVTVTGTTGADVDLTTKVFNGVTNIRFDIARSVVSLTLSTGQILDLDYSLTTTVTYTISGGVATVTIS